MRCFSKHFKCMLTQNFPPDPVQDGKLVGAPDATHKASSISLESNEAVAETLPTESAALPQP